MGASGYSHVDLDFDDTASQASTVRAGPPPAKVAESSLAQALIPSRSARSAFTVAKSDVPEISMHTAAQLMDFDDTASMASTVAAEQLPSKTVSNQTPSRLGILSRLFG